MNRPTFADPKTGFVFKRMFAHEANKPLLIALLNDLLELQGARRIAAVDHLPPEQHVAIQELKLSIVDVKCTDRSGARFVVEMQVLNVEGFEKRVVYNAAKAYVMQLRTADAYPELCDVVGVTICNFCIWPETDASGAYTVPMLSHWRMREDRSGQPGLPQIQHVFLELPKYASGATPQTAAEHWAYLFRETARLDEVPPGLSGEPWASALEVARVARFSPAEWEAYDRARMAETDARGALSVARREGKAEGKAEGLAEGRRAALRDALAAKLRLTGQPVDEAELGPLDEATLLRRLVG